MKNRIADLFLRIAAYSVLIIIAYQFFVIDSTGKLYEGQKFSEFTFTEFYQEMLFLWSSILFFIVAVKYRDSRPNSILAGGFFLICFIRELDFASDRIAFFSWTITAFTVLGITLFLSWKSRKNFTPSFNEYYNSKSFAFLLSGIMVTFLFSRLYGKSELWMALMEDGYQRSVKNASEECVEVMGDILIFISSVEYFLFKVQQNRKLKKP